MSVKTFWLIQDENRRPYPLAEFLIKSLDVVALREVSPLMIAVAPWKAVPVVPNPSVSPPVPSVWR
jgi:hypothetical protein